VPTSAPAMVEGEDGGFGSESSLLAGVPLSAPGGQTDPQMGQTSSLPTLELMPNQATHQYEAKLPLSDSGVPGGLPPDAAAVGERVTSSAARRPSTPRPRATSSNLTLSAQQMEKLTGLERPEPAPETMGQFGSPLPPSLSPHQETGSYGAPSPPIGSDIEEYFPVAETAMYRPSLLEIWTETDPTFLPRTAAASVNSSRAGTATGGSQLGPAEFAGVEERPASLTYSFADISGQQRVDRPGMVDIIQPGLAPNFANNQFGLQPVVSVVPVVSGLSTVPAMTVPAYQPGAATLEATVRRLPATAATPAPAVSAAPASASQYAAAPTPVPTAPASATAAPAPAFAAAQYASQYAAVHTMTETLTAQSLLLLGRHTTTPQLSPHSSVEQWLQCTERMAASPLPANSIPSSVYAGPHITLPVGAEAATLAPRQ